MWAYEWSAARHAAVQQSLGEPDPFRFKRKDALRQIVGEVVRDGMNRKAAAAHIVTWVEKNLPEADREKFRDMAETELLSLHEGNFARYHIRPSEFQAWQKAWSNGNKAWSDALYNTSGSIPFWTCSKREFGGQRHSSEQH